MRDILQTTIQLDQIKCHDEGDGWGNAEPYLWTVFFKIDGTSVMLTDDLKLSGSATIATTPGSHGNLGTTDVDEGDVVNIPDAIGSWTTTLTPIPVPDFVKALGVDDLPAIAGVVCVLMEEDNVSDEGAEAGHQALNNAVQNALDEIIATRSVSNQDITEAEVNTYVDTMKSAISDAVKDQQNFFENFWSWLNSDDVIGSQVWQFTQDTLLDNNPVQLEKRWKSEGDWELLGHIDTSVLCPANAVEAAAKFFKEPFGTDMKQMRAFRDGEFRKLPGLQAWWAIARRNTPQLASVLMKDKLLRKSAVSLVSGINDALKNRKKVIEPHYWQAAGQLMEKLAKTGNRRTRIDMSRALDMLPHLRDKTTDQVIQLLSALEPARHPRTNKLTKTLKPGRLMKRPG